MQHFILSVIAFLITITVVIGIHEFGHFLAARLFRIKVLRFSIGFGKKLFGFVDKKGTEYRVSVIPLGGYVKLLDENEGVVAASELHLAFNRQPVYQRIIVILAGPLLNLLLALFVFWLMFMIGFSTVKPIIGKISPNSIADLAGLKPQQEILAVDNRRTTDWSAVLIRMFFRFGSEDTMQITAKLPTKKTANNYQLNLTDWQMNELKPDPLKSLGIIPYQPYIPAIIGSVIGQVQQLKVGDEVLAIGKYPVKDWFSLVEQIQLHPNQELQFQIKRNNEIIYAKIKIGSKRISLTRNQGFLGIKPQFTWPEKYLNHNKYSLFPALQQAFGRTITFTKLNLVLIGKMITGDFSVRGLAGPLTIFTTAGRAFHLGLTAFLSFLGFISATIGLFNLLPIPGLDGAHICYFIIEAIIGRPVSVRVQMLAFKLGLLVILLIMLQAIINDFLRLVK
ncbi:MAG: RIP metalloprotease RseP [Gammaproteobacteria bacterium]|jgi:regulator of sigma E protease